MPLISPNFDVKVIIFPKFGQGPFLELEKALGSTVSFLSGTHNLLVENEGLLLIIQLNLQILYQLAFLIVNCTFKNELSD